MIELFVSVSIISLILENISGCIKEFSGLYEIIDNIGYQVKSLDKYLFLLLAGKCKLNKLEYFFIWESLFCPKWREVLNVIDNIVSAEDEVAYIVVLGLKQAPM